MIKKIVTVDPRGFCAGVARSVNVVEDCLNIFGKPVYIKHAIVHNKTVVSDLENKGAITVETVEEIPEGSIAVFSAHGSPPEHFEKARERNIKVIDATCPLVTKVHMEMVKFIQEGYRVVYIGHKGHVEGLGVVGEAEKLGINVEVLESIHDVDGFECGEDEKLAFLTQTTLSVEETDKIITALKSKCINIVSPTAADICYATTNRQSAISDLAKKVDIIFVVGSKTSSNSKRLVEVAKQNGCKAYLIDEAKEIDTEWLCNIEKVGVSAGASAPEYRVQEVVEYFVQMGAIHEKLSVVEENMVFTEPVELTKAKRGDG
ncbi:MAG: 4-hydroxy-3-methylbut-2-enyl diphosphate reductase [Candidatus Moraniibacteriota bacterium]|jgi:4-hydroxy-3-methylbut-2-en-1-yl diphosphate reductase